MVRAWLRRNSAQPGPAPHRGAGSLLSISWRLKISHTVDGASRMPKPARFAVHTSVTLRRGSLRPHAPPGPGCLPGPPAFLPGSAATSPPSRGTACAGPSPAPCPGRRAGAAGITRTAAAGVAVRRAGSGRRDPVSETPLSRWRTASRWRSTKISTSLVAAAAAQQPDRGKQVSKTKVNQAQQHRHHPDRQPRSPTVSPQNTAAHTADGILGTQRAPHSGRRPDFATSRCAGSF
jgi:hypothetical protein